MTLIYFNHSLTHAQSGWERGAFLRRWWRFYERDSHWTPPDYSLLRRILQPGASAHLQRLDPALYFAEAVSRQQPDVRSNLAGAGHGIASGWEKTVAATVVMRGRASPPHLALFRCLNDRASLTYFLRALAEERGVGSFIGPVHLSPYLGAGCLESHWHLLAPLHTPYNPPYLPGLLHEVMSPILTSHLYHLPVPSQPGPNPDQEPARLLPLQPERLAGDLLPLLAAACTPWKLFAPPDQAEAAFLLRWLGRWPLHGWLAQVDGVAAGFVLLQPDLSPALQRAYGGRNLFWRFWLRYASQRPTHHGRLLFASVLPAHRGQGIGRQLLHAALTTAANEGWQSLRIGPLPEKTPGAQFLTNQGAEAQQTYQLYRWSV